MALATQCPHCQTRFRVASDQLKLRGGIVRCGACQRIFDGSAHLIDLEAEAAAKAAALAAAAAAAAVVAEPPPPAVDVTQATPATPAAANVAPVPDADFAAQPVYTLDFASTFDPLGILPDAAQDDAVQDAADPAPQDPEPAHGDVLAHAVEAIADAEVEVEAGPFPGSDADDAADAADADDAADAAALQPDDPAPVIVTAPASFMLPGRIEPSFDLPVDEELVARPLPDHDPDPEPEPALEPEPEPDLAPASIAGEADPAPDPATDSAADDAPPTGLPLRASAGAALPDAVPAAAGGAAAPRSARAKAAEARARRSRLTPTRIEAPKLRVAETDEPEFVKRSRKQEQAGRTRRILLAIGAVVLLLVLAAQLVLNFRNVLAARYPGARPALGAACALLGCRVELPTQIDNLAIEDGELSTLGPDTYALNTLLRNQGSLVQAWPSIELELTDANKKPLLRRVFTPAEYLAQGVSAANGFAGRSEQPVKLHFALADLKPSDYHIFIFYP